MRKKGRVEIGPYGGTSKSARAHQAFLVTDDGERLQLRRYDGPSMRDPELEALAGQEVVVDGLLRSNLFIAKTLAPAAKATAPSPGTPTSASAETTTRKS